jgi:hypothetical protein
MPWGGLGRGKKFTTHLGLLYNFRLKIQLKKQSSYGELSLFSQAS